MLLRTSFKESRLTRRLLVYVLISVVIFSVITTLVQMVVNYRQVERSLNTTFDYIQNSYVDGISISVYALNETQTKHQLKGILNFPYIEYVSVEETFGDDIIRTVDGDPAFQPGLIREFQLFYPDSSKVEASYGTLIVGADTKKAYSRVRKEALIFFGVSLVGFGCVVLSIFIVFQVSLTRHLISMSRYTDRLNLDELETEFKLNRKIPKIWADDELERLARALNKMRARLKQDLADIKKSEDAVRRSETLFRAITSQAGEGIFLADTGGNYILVNPPYCRLTGYPESRLLKMNVKELIPKGTLPLFSKGGMEKNGQVETALIRKDNTSFTAQVNCAPIQLEDRTLNLAIVRDVTRQREAEESIKASHERFLTVMNSIDATVYVADIQTNEILFMNQYMIESFGRDFTGEMCWKVFQCNPAPCSHCTNKDLLDDDGKSTGVNVWQGKNPVTGKWYINHDRAIEWTDGRMVRLQIATDITELKSMEEELRQAHKMESIGTLAGGIAHDFNNILGIVIGNTELAMEDLAEDHPAKIYVRKVKTASLRAKDVVRQLLSFSRKSESARKPISILPVVMESVQLLRASISSDIKIHTEIAESTGFIKADPTQMQQVLINLATNAAQAMDKKGGVITIAAKQIDAAFEPLDMDEDVSTGRYVRITVRDTGSGIDPGIRSRIFDPYFTTKEVGKGSGMGLSIVHGIVKGHEGLISVKSRPGQGTVVAVAIPVSEEIRAIEKKVPDTVPKGSEKILFVDDESAIVVLVGEMLTRLGYQVETCLNPIEALERFKEAPNQFDLVITDMTMPDINGLQLFDQLKAVRNDIPVIVCTGFSSKIDESESSNLGISAVIMKPVERKEMARSIRQVLDKTG